MNQDENAESIADASQSSTEDPPCGRRRFLVISSLLLFFSLFPNLVIGSIICLDSSAAPAFSHFEVDTRSPDY